MNIKSTIKRLKPGTVQEMGILIALVVLCAFFTIASGGKFARVDNAMTVLRQVSMATIVAAGMTFIMITANIDLAVGSYLALTGVMLAKLLNVGCPWYVAIAVTMLAMALINAIVGTAISKQKLQSLIITLAMMAAARGFALSWTDGQPVYYDNNFIYELASGYVWIFPIPVIVMVFVLAITQFVLKKTRFGRYVHAVGGNQEAAITSGINVDRVKIGVFAISGALTGLAGCIMAGRLMSGSPIAGQGFELDVIAGVVIGGTSLKGGYGGMVGTLLGVVTVGVIANGLTILGVEYYYQLMAKGAIIYLAMVIDSGTRKVKR
ncbi:MAG: ABC transporter permease [Planctomycetes bacterium]|nr:ABC transporter permease [Planctomycetota bacterium]